MLVIEQNISLRPYNTFGVEAMARYFCRITTDAQLQKLIGLPLYQQSRRLIIGEGSNLLFTKDFPGLVIRMEMKGIDTIAVSDDTVMITASAGESWHGLVLYCVDRDYGGLENLSLIPGTCGAAPIQNIGAYGVEIENRIKKVTAVNASDGELRTFNKDECLFNYRESVFKHALREKYFISSITLTLSKKNHVFNIGYGALRDTLIQREVDVERDLTIKAISDAVIQIRQQKLPDVHELGSAGSFFKNPVVGPEVFESIKKISPTVPFYPTVNQNVKIPAGWMIEACGWKGKRFGNVGVHTHQALVLVNYGGGTGAEIFQLANAIRNSVREKFDVLLDYEVNIL